MPKAAHRRVISAPGRTVCGSGLMAMCGSPCQSAGNPDDIRQIQTPQKKSTRKRSRHSTTAEAPRSANPREKGAACTCFIDVQHLQLHPVAEDNIVKVVIHPTHVQPGFFGFDSQVCFPGSKHLEHQKDVRQKLALQLSLPHNLP